MRRTVRAAMRSLRVVAAAVAVVSCATAAPSTATSPATPGSATAAPSPSVAPTIAAEPSTGTFESTRHGYRAEVPPGWRVTEYEGTWTALAQFDPGAEVPGEDVIAPPGIASFVVINSMAIPEGTTATDWHAAFDAAVVAGLTATCPGTTGAGVVSGEPATIVEQPCEGSVITGRSLTHGGRGYYVTTRVPAGDATTTALLEGVVDSIQFVDE